jgi:DNA-binding MarR family transcriptional regulator
MTIDTKNASLALEMIKAELGGRPTMNTLQTFLLIAEHDRGDARDLERQLKATSGTLLRALAFWTDKNLIVREHVLRGLRIRRFRTTYQHGWRKGDVLRTREHSNVA